MYSMPRKARIDAPLSLHHLIARGIERRNIFRDNKDRYDFIDRLASVLSDSQTPCYAWALMPNHLHLLLRTGNTPISHVMRRLLTGYVVTFNRRHKRTGRLFQNRFKSILCQEEVYFRELIRYIHLNPIRSKQVDSLEALARHKFCGHGVILGYMESAWLDRDAVLSHFGQVVSEARKNYVSFVEKGIDQGRRPQLTGGGIVRSMGGWTQYMSSKKMNKHLKGDERILGDSDFVRSILKSQNERMERKYRLRSSGVDFNSIANRVAELYQLEPESLLIPRRHGRYAEARALLCHWSISELGMTGKELSEILAVSTAAVSKLLAKGRKLADKTGFKFIIA